MRRRSLVLFFLGAVTLSGLAAQETFTVWHYETSALAASWDRALQLFQASHPGVKVVLTVKTFEEMQATADRVLAAAEVPDVMEFNKGNSNAGYFTVRGALSDLTAEASRRGWDRLLSPGLQTTVRYDRGLMGSGPWYGVSSYGEFVLVYYNKPLFRAAGIKVPTTLAEFESAMTAFAKRGVIPLSLGASGSTAQHLLYELYLAGATRAEVRDYQMYGAPVDFQSGNWKRAAETLAKWAASGLFSPGALTMNENAMLAEFVKGRAAMMLGGSWLFPRLLENANLDWGSFLFPGNTLHPGSGGNLWVVPTRSKHPEWAAEFIDLTLRPDIQTALANGGGIAINAEKNKITNPRGAELIRSFDQVLKSDALAFYPDWPALGYYDSLFSAARDLIKGVAPSRVLEGLDLAYRTKKGRL